VKYRLEATLVTADANAEMVVPHSLDLTCKTNYENKTSLPFCEIGAAFSSL
jgi:hypothetical protein